MQPSILRYGLPLVFAFAVVAYWLDASLGLLSHRPSVENRIPAERPSLKLGKPEPFPAAYEKYFNDAFLWRGDLQALNARLQSLTNGRSPLPDLVVIGKDDWYFKGGLQLDIYRGKLRFTPEQLTEVTDKLVERQRYVAARGGTYLFAVPPLKHHIYTNHLPDYVRPLNLEHATLQLYAALDRVGVPYVNLHEALAAAAGTAATENLYYRTDHHWSVEAGLVATDAILAHEVLSTVLRTSAPAPEYYFTERAVDGMLLAQLAGKARKNQEIFHDLHRRGDWITHPVERGDIVPPAAFPFPNEYVKQREANGTPTEKTVSLFVTRESFGENLYLPMSEAFDRSFWLFDEWKHGLNADRYDREGGDVYLQLVWEGFLFNLLDDPPDDGRWK